MRFANLTDMRSTATACILFPRDFLWGVASAILVILLLALVAPPAHALVSEAQVEREAEKVFRQMKARIPISRDVRATEYVQCVAGMIIAQLDEPYLDLDWEVVLFENEAANAFAMPGGKVGVFTGIFSVAGDQDALATVLGHEVAHVTSEHSLKRARKQVRNDLLVIAAAGALGGGSRTANALSLGAELGLNRPYDRKQESEADIEGLELMSRAGFDPRASIGLWKNMAKQSPGSPPEFLSTHPSSDDRISRLIRGLATSLAAYNEAHSLGHVPQCR